MTKRFGDDQNKDHERAARRGLFNTRQEDAARTRN